MSCRFYGRAFLFLAKRLKEGKKKKREVILSDK
jgi:hypothetical protein